MTKILHKHLLSMACLAAALSVGLVGTTVAATDSPKPSASTPVPAAKGNHPVVDELVVVESIQLTPVNQTSKIIGSALHTSDNKKVGDVKDILIGDDNKIVAVTVGVGGLPRYRRNLSGVSDEKHQIFV